MKKEDLRQAMDVLVKYGFFLRVKDLEIYHGRVEEAGDTQEWEVDPNFNNAGNSTGNHNINKISALSAGDKDVALAFAKARVFDKKWEEKTTQDRKDYEAKVYKIESYDENAVIINKKFDFSKLSNKDADVIQKALATICNYSITHLAPIKFEDRDNYIIVKDKIKSYMAHSGVVLLSQQDIDTLYENIIQTNPEIKKDLVFHLASALNSRRLLLARTYTAKLVEKCFVGDGREKTEVFHGFPVNVEYISAWLSNNHVVGIVRDIDSATLDKRVEAYSLFDLEKINTQKATGEKLQEILQQYQQINSIISDFKFSEDASKFLIDSSASEILDKIAGSEKYGKLFNLDAGVWEGFSIKEHTETTIRIFEDTYEDSVPKETASFIKLALLGHDIGKGLGGNLRNNNILRAKEFYDDLNVPEQMKNLLLFAIDSYGAQEFTSRYYVRKDTNAINELTDECRKFLKEVLGKEPTDEEVKGYVNICKIIQTCDSGAYTRYGITRDKKTGAYYYNGNDRFTRSFKQPTGLAGRKLELIDPNEKI